MKQNKFTGIQFLKRREERLRTKKWQDPVMANVSKEYYKDWENTS